MEIRVLASSSAGNCYVISDGTSKLLLECGIPMRQIERGTGHTVSQMAGCLISHAHADHSRAVAEVMRAAVDVYASRSCLEAIGINSHRAVPLVPREPATIGSWRVLPFEAVHDVECLGFLIASGKERLLYLTDSAYSPKRFRGLTHVMVGTNYSAELLRFAPPEHKARVIQTHMSVERVIEMLEANDLSAVRAIWLLHLSDEHSDEEGFRKAVAEGTGKPVYVAPRRSARLGGSSS